MTDADAGPGAGDADDRFNKCDLLHAVDARFGGRDGRMLAAWVEPKNGPQENKKTGNFKPVVLGQFRTGVDML
jgi:hypothetical protein